MYSNQELVTQALILITADAVLDSIAGYPGNCAPAEMRVQVDRARYNLMLNLEPMNPAVGSMLRALIVRYLVEHNCTYIVDALEEKYLPKLIRDVEEENAGSTQAVDPE